MWRQGRLLQLIQSLKTIIKTVSSHGSKIKMRCQKVLTQKPTLSTLCLSCLKITVISFLCVFLESFHSLMKDLEMC